MLDTSHVLDRLGINRVSVIQGTQDVANRIRDASDACAEARRIYQQILSKDVIFRDAVQARVAAKALIREVISAGCEIDDAQLFVDESLEYANEFCADPAWSFLWAQPESESTIKVENTVQVVEDIDIKVAVKEDGKIKKGGKQVLAFEMYKQYVVEADQPLTNQQFISLIMDKLGMSKAGSTTYAYNAAKHFKALKEIEAQDGSNK